jgi:hypothetical protein
MDESARMRLPHRSDERDRDAQKLYNSQWPAEQSIKDHAPRVRKYQRQAIAMAGKLNWTRRPGGIQVGPERVLVFDLIVIDGRRLFRRGQQDWR